MSTESAWHGDAERLDRALASLGLVRSRNQAQEIIASGGAYVDDVRVDKPATRVLDGATLSVRDVDPYVSRGAHKLIAALDAFAIDPLDSVALDLGASTGGFTQVLLERGARKVLAVDVGHDQLAATIRSDDRVSVVEGCNARGLDREQLAQLTGVSEVPSIVVADLSFISLTLVLPAIARCTDSGADVALLIKPQFEVGRVKNGVVVDPAQWEMAIRQVLDAAAVEGFTWIGLAPSPIPGGEGNREFLVHFRRGEPRDPREWEDRVFEVCASAPARDK